MKEVNGHHGRWLMFAVQWIIDCPLNRNPSPRNGCDGHRCGRAHPCITLQFDLNQNATIAHLSHALDPFVQYFEILAVGRGLAKTQFDRHQRAATSRSNDLADYIIESLISTFIDLRHIVYYYIYHIIWLCATVSF